jgi:alkylated DNA repair dioxygenase AlkB
MAKDLSGWSCTTCTYRHECSKERQYLSCAVCGAPKPTVSQRPSQLQRKRGSSQLLLSSSSSSSKEPKSPSSHASIRSDTGDCKKHKQEPQAHRRSILQVLKPCRASSFIPPARYRESPREDWRTVDLDKIPTLCPMTVVHNVLPDKLANALLKQLEADSQSWNRGNWIVHGKEHLIPRTTATFSLAAQEKEGDNSTMPATQSTATITDEEDGEYLDKDRPISPELRQTASCIAALVNKHCSWAASSELGSWEPTFALANRYANCVGWHADHITPLGPRPIIVGLSLGACRRFELRRQNTAKDRTPHVSVPLPHNSAAIMWNDAQESWQHSVPRCMDESYHPLVGPVRISMTFRRQRNLPSLGTCHCGRPVGLKAKDGLYYTFCRPYGKDKHKTCNFWKRCLWAEQEALRLVQLEKVV